MARELSAVLTAEQIETIAQNFVQQGFQAQAVLLQQGMQDKLATPANVPANMPLDIAIAQWALDHNEAAGLGTDTLPSAPVLYLLLQAPMRTRGILAVQPRRQPWLPSPAHERVS